MRHSNSVRAAIGACVIVLGIPLAIGAQHVASSEQAVDTIPTSSAGSGVLVAQAEGAPPAADPALLEALMGEGGGLYRRNCAECHGDEGQGGAGEVLAGDGLLADATVVARQIIHGGAYMPPFGRLTDRNIAAVATFVRNSFGNSFGIVTEADVAANR